MLVSVLTGIIELWFNVRSALFMLFLEVTFDIIGLLPGLRQMPKAGLLSADNSASDPRSQGQEFVTYRESLK